MVRYEVRLLLHCFYRLHTWPHYTTVYSHCKMDVHIEYENWNYPQLDPSEDKHIAGPMTAMQGQ